ncbi:MAG: lipopolysaccharide kinase InaA family protein [Phycisphaerae bacterium]
MAIPPETASGQTPPSTDAGKVLYADDSAAAILRPHLESLNRPAGPAWKVVKQNPSRTVYAGAIAGKEVYLKHFHGRSLGHRLAAFLGYKRAMKELDLASHLGRNGVSATPILAAMSDGSTEWVVSSAVAPAVPANVWHARQLEAGSDGAAAIRRATVALADMIGKMHAAGVSHDDLHCGNILVRAGGGELVLMDLHRARRRRRLGRRARAANLAQLLYDRCDWTTRTDRLRFLKRYLQAARPGAGGTLRGWVAMIEDAAARHRARQYASEEGKIYGRNRYFAPMRLRGGWRGRVMLTQRMPPGRFDEPPREFTAAAWREALGDVDSLFAGEGVQVVKDSRSGRVIRRRLDVGGHRLDVYIKRPRRKYAWKAIIDCFRSSRPKRAFALGHALLIRNIPTALPLAFLQRRAGPLLVDSILITETVEGSRLNDFLATWLADPPRGNAAIDRREQHRLAQDVIFRLGRLLQRLHDNNFAHRDLKETNMIVRWSPGRKPDIVLLDLDGLRRVRKITTRRRFQGLMRLNVSLLTCPTVNPAGRLRMLLGYLRRPGCGRIDFKTPWRVLEQWSEKKLRRQIASNRRKQKAQRVG